jgi:hypothetical protein
MVTPPFTAIAAMPSVSAPSPAPAAHETSFGDVLSALNPLQYLPGVGTIYRAITGDSPPEPIRAIGSIIAGGLLGGPIGAVISAVSSLMQHVTGIDLDHVAHDVMANLGLIGDTPAPSTVAALPAQAPITQTAAHSATAAEAPVPVWRASPETDAAVPNAVQLRIAIAAYDQQPIQRPQRLGHV